jgi:hypothetical protein
MIRNFRINGVFKFYHYKILAASFLMFYLLNATLFAIIFISCLLLITKISVNKLEVLTLYLIYEMLILDVLRMLDLAKFESLPIVFTLLFVIGVLKVQNSKEYSQKSKLSLNFVYLVLPVIYIFQFTSEEFKLFLIKTTGYDQVGHFAITKMLSSCSGFISECDPQSSSLPFNYGHYPQQWHILFSNFINLDGLKGYFESYLIVIFASLAINIFLIHFSIEKFKLSYSSMQYQFLQPKKLHFNILESLFFVMIIYLTLMGYPNFVFAICLIIASVFIFNSDNKFFLSSLTLLFASSTYTLFLPLSLSIVLFLTLLVLKQKKLNLIQIIFLFANTIMWAIYTLFVLLTIRSDQKASPSQISFLAYGQVDFNIPTIVVEVLMSLVLLFSVYLFAKYRQYLTGKLTELYVVHALVLFCLIGLNIFMLSKGFKSSYYLTKFSYFALFIGTLTLFVSVFVFRDITKEKTFKPLTSFKITCALLLYLSMNSLFTQISNYHLLNSIAKDFIYYREVSSTLKSQLQAVAISIDLGKPIIFLSDNSGPDTQWVNSISGNWSAYLNNFLENDFDNEKEFRSRNFQESTSDKILIFDSQFKG